MTKGMLHRLAGTARRHVLGFARDGRGSVSMEFVVLFPVLVILLVVAFTGFNAFRSSTQFSKTAYTVNDILSRYDVLDTQAIADVAVLQSKLVSNGVDEHVLRVTSICFQGGSYRVMWSQVETSLDVVANPELAATIPLLQPMTDATIPTALMPSLANQEAVLFTESSAVYQPLMQSYWGEQRWYSYLAVRPRFVRIIPHDDLNTANLCPSPSPTPPPVAMGDDDDDDDDD